VKPKAVQHGVFLVAPELIKKAGFGCKTCGAQVTVVRQGFPQIVAPRLCAFTCGCGATVMVWEDERQPSRRSWSLAMKLARRTRAELLIFNGNKPTPPEFSGIN
jgi:hypothetical protein